MTAADTIHPVYAYLIGFAGYTLTAIALVLALVAATKVCNFINRHLRGD